jgi:prepilin-type N-terminal cleavage/methylation domain-containing protein
MKSHRGLTLIELLIGITIGVIVLSLLFIGPIARHMSKTNTIMTVDRRERVNQNNEKSRYLIWSKEGEVFQCTDDWAFLKWNSSDVYGQLKEGGQYRVEVAGWRVPFFSWYRNILRAEEVTPDPPQ